MSHIDVKNWTFAPFASAVHISIQYHPAVLWEPSWLCRCLSQGQGLGLLQGRILFGAPKWNWKGAWINVTRKYPLELTNSQNGRDSNFILYGVPESNSKRTHGLHSLFSWKGASNAIKQSKTKHVLRHDTGTGSFQFIKKKKGGGGKIR